MRQCTGVPGTPAPREHPHSKELRALLAMSQGPRGDPRSVPADERTSRPAAREGTLGPGGAGWHSAQSTGSAPGSGRTGTGAGPGGVGEASQEPVPTLRPNGLSTRPVLGLVHAPFPPQPHLAAPLSDPKRCTRWERSSPPSFAQGHSHGSQRAAETAGCPAGGHGRAGHAPTAGAGARTPGSGASCSCKGLGAGHPSQGPSCG